MTKKINKKLIAFGVIAVMLAVAAAAAVALSVMPLSDAALGVKSVGQVMNIVTDDGKLTDKITMPANGKLPITTSDQLYAFIDKTGEYANCDYGYLTNDLSVNKSSENYGMSTKSLAKGRTLDGNGYSIAVINDATTSWNMPNFLDVDFGSAQIAKNWDNGSQQSSVLKVTSGFIALNRGEIKNLTFDYNFSNWMRYNTTKNIYNMHYIGIIVGLNQGKINNVRANINGETMSIHREQAGNANKIVVGGLAAMNMGEIDSVTVDSNIRYDVNSKSGDYSTHSVLGGIVGKMLSYSGSEGGNYIATATLKDSVILGGGYYDTQGEGGPNGHRLNEVGLAVGSNTVAHGTGNRDSGDGFSNGIIDGIIIGSTGTVGQTSGAFGSQGNHSSGSTLYPAVDCGQISNVFYAYNYGELNGRVTNCTYNAASHSTHASQKFSEISIAHTVGDASKYVFDMSINRDKGIESGGKEIYIDIDVSVKDASSTDVIYKLESVKYNVKNDQGTEETLATTVLGGVNYKDADGKTTFYDDAAEINRKHAAGTVSEARGIDGKETSFTKTLIYFGETASIKVQSDRRPTPGEDYVLPFTGKAMSFSVYKDSDGSEFSGYSTGEAEIHSTAELTVAGKKRNFELKEAKMPGVYKNAVIVSAINSEYGYLNNTECLVAPLNPLSSVLGENANMVISPLGLNIDNPNDENATYKNYTFNLSMPEGKEYVNYVMYTAHGVVWQNIADGTDFRPEFNYSSVLTDDTGSRSYPYSVSFAGYTKYTYKNAADIDETIFIAVTEATAPRTLTIDADAPEVQYVDASGSNIAKPDYDAMEWSKTAVDFRFRATDAVSGVQSVTVNGDAVTADANGIYTVQVFDSSTVRIIVTDGIGNEYKDLLKFKVDTSAPTFSIAEKPQDGSAIASVKNVALTLNIASNASGYSVFLAKKSTGASAYGAFEPIELDKDGKYTLTSNGAFDYRFKVVSGAGLETTQDITVNIVKTPVSLTNDDILYDGNGIAKDYDGTDALEADDLARISWNPASPNYSVLKNMGISARYETANVKYNNRVIVSPVDSDGSFEFNGSIVYSKASITEKSLTIVIHDAVKEYGDLDPEFTYEYLGGISAADEAAMPRFVIISDVAADAGIGTYNIVLEKTLAEINEILKLGGSNYKIGKINSGTLTIKSKVLDADYRIVNSQVGADYTGAPVEVTAEYLFNGEWKKLGVKYYSLPNNTLLDGAPTNVGNYAYELYIEDANYIFSEVHRFEFTIHTAQVNISILEAGAAAEYKVTYDGKLAPITIKIDNGDTSNFTVTFKDAEGNALAAQPVDAGNYKIEVRYTPVDHNFKETYKSFDFIVQKANFKDLGVKFESADFEFVSGKSHTLDVFMPDIDYLKNGTTVLIYDADGNEYLPGDFSAELTGTYKLKAVFKNKNFETYEAEAQLVIHKTMMTDVAFKDTTFVYDGMPHTMYLDGLPEGAVVNLTYTGTDYEGVTVGESSITAVNAGAYQVAVTITAENYETKILAGNLQIKKAVLGYEFDNVSVDYDGQEHILRARVPDGIAYELSFVSSDEDNIGGVILSDAEGMYFKAVRPNKYVVRLFVNDRNYSQVATTRTLTINKLSLSDAVKASGYSVTFEEGKEYRFAVNSDIAGVNYKITCDKAGVVTDGGQSASYILPGAGTYHFTVTAGKEFYNNLTITSTVTIFEANMSAYFEGPSMLTYNGSDINVFLRSLPKDAVVEWVGGDGVTVDSAHNMFTVRNSGTYKVTAKVTAKNYKSKAIEHKITVYDAQMPDEVKNSVKNSTFEYTPDGRIFEVKGVPQGSAVEISIRDSSGNEILPMSGTAKYLIIEPGEYTIKVSVKAENYQEFTPEVKWLITEGIFRNLSAENKTYKYDGSDKSIELSGFPDGASVTFAYDGVGVPATDGRYIFSRAEVGDYVVDYTVSKNNYKPVSGQIRLTITENDFNDINIPNKTFTYTGSEQVYDISAYLPDGAAIRVVSIDDGVTVSSNYKAFGVRNVKFSGGLVSSYRITLELTRLNYVTKEFSFGIRVDQAEFGVTIGENKFTFDETEHALVLSGVPDGATVKYECNGEVTDSFSRMRAGTYYVNVMVEVNENYKEFVRNVQFVIEKGRLPEFVFGNHEFQWEPNHKDFIVDVLDTDGNAINLGVYDVKWSNGSGNVFNSAGNYNLGATVTKKGFEKDYEPLVVTDADGNRSITVIVKPKTIESYIYIDVKASSESSSMQKVFDGVAVTVDIYGVPEGATVKWNTEKSFVNAGTYTATAEVSMPNYATVTVDGYITIKPLEVDVKYFVKPSYYQGEEPRVVGRYTDINGKEIDFLVDTASLRRAEEGSYEVSVKSLGDSNYKAKETCSTVEVTIGQLMGTSNIGAIVGGAAGGSVALGGGIAALVVILMKKKSIKL